MHVLHFITMANFSTLASYDPRPPVKPLLNFLEKQFRKAHSLLNKQNSLLQKPVKICLCLKTETYLTAPKCLVFANDLVHTRLSSLPPPQACLELACASTCLTYHTKVQQLPLRHPLCLCGPHLSNHLLFEKALFLASPVSLTWQCPSSSVGSPSFRKYWP